MKAFRILVGADVPPDPNSGAAGTVYATNVALRELGHDVDEIWATDLPRRIRHGNLHYLLELPRAYRHAVRNRSNSRDYDVIQLSQPYAWLAAREHQQAGRSGVFVNRSHGLEVLADAVVPRWHKRLGVPENRFLRSIPAKLLRRGLHRFTSLAARYSDGVIVPAQDCADCLIGGLSVPAAKVALIHHGINELYITRNPPPMTQDRQHRILYVGQYAFFKAPHLLARIFGLVLGRHSRATATWVCGATHHAAIRAILDRNIMDRVRLLDWMPQEDLLKVYDSHGIFLFPSFYDGAAKSCLEALARGLCVVASDVGGMRDYIRHGENGFRLPVGDVEGFAAATMGLLSDLPLCQRISAAARGAAVAYSWRRCAEKATAFYDRLLQDRLRRENVGSISQSVAIHSID